MRYFDIPTIKAAIEQLQTISANWLLPAFVFAANDVGTDELVDLSERLGTDQFLDRYFNGRRLGLAPFPSGNNLLRPRLRGIRWDKPPFAGDYIIRQDTKMWGNLFSSRGYREMRLEGLIEGERAINVLTDAFQPRFEQEIPASFRFEDFMVWIFAFEGFPEEVNGWAQLHAHLLDDELKLQKFKSPYEGRFRLTNPPPAWPQLLSTRPSNEEFLKELAPNLVEYLATGSSDSAGRDVYDESSLPQLGPDDPGLSTLTTAIQHRESLAFLLAGPPGTGKTRYARQLAIALVSGDISRTLFLQFHPAIGYDDFVEGFRPAPETGDGTGVQYKLEPRLFLAFAAIASKNPHDKYVVVIDELNRGDVARVFGEVLTYLEADYRGQEFTLSFSGKLTSLPPNLIVIATANPFDRSVTDLDDALLRRFWVIELEPNPTLLKKHLQANGVEAGVISRTMHMFNILNEALPTGFGHTTFLRVRTIEDLAAIWNARLRLVLRRAFIHDRPAYESTSAEIEKLLSSSTGTDDSEAGAGI